MDFNVETDLVTTAFKLLWLQSAMYLTEWLNKIVCKRAYSLCLYFLMKMKKVTKILDLKKY